jgi:hypothetical protein
MYEVRRTDEFMNWLAGLKDIEAKVRIAKRIDRIAGGNFGDAKSIGNGVSELRFDFWAGLPCLLYGAWQYCGDLALWWQQANATKGHRTRHHLGQGGLKNGN